jgi:hypothetical protein
LKPEPNVQIQFCAFEKCPFHAIADRSCPRNRAIKRDMNDWLRIASEVYAWDYVFNLNAVDMPFADLHTLGPNLRYYAKRGVRGAFIQGNGRCPGGEFSDLRCYVISRLLWNPQQDEEALIAEFLRLHFGESAAAIRAYLDIVDAAANRTGTHASILSLAPELGLTAEDAQRGLEVFDKALISADNDQIRARVVKASLPAYKAAIETSGRLTFAEGRISVVYPDWMQSRFREYSERCANVGMDRSAEFASLEEYLEDVARNRSGVEAAQIEDNTWRVTLVPAMNGAIVAMYHKPTGRDLLNALNEPGINLRHGVLRETIVEGLSEAGSLQSELTPVAATITRRLPNGTTATRTISLNDGALRSTTDIKHEGNEPARYRVELSAGFRGADALDRMKRLRGYVKTTTWHRTPAMSIESDAEDATDQPEGTGIAWFNRNEQFGASIQYPTGQFESPLLFARPGLLEVSTEMTTPERTLNTDESLRIEYTIAAGPVR